MDLTDRQKELIDVGRTKIIQQAKKNGLVINPENVIADEIDGYVQYTVQTITRFSYRDLEVIQWMQNSKKD